MKPVCPQDLESGVPRQLVLHGYALRIAQAAWDRCYRQHLVSYLHVSNPGLRKDLALNRAIRELGQRPRAPFTREQLLDEYDRLQIHALIQKSGSVRDYGPSRRGPVFQDCVEHGVLEMLF